jgi:AmiR/NasT family two-component response regulator
MRTQDPPSAVVRRTASGWVVDGDTPEEVDGLVEAMVLADLVAADSGGPARPQQRPGPADQKQDETAQLRVAVSQLQHALTVRVTIEQAIGVLAERSRRPPRDAFEHLRKVARSHGRRVHDIAAAVVASVTDPSVVLPGDLPGRD